MALSCTQPVSRARNLRNRHPLSFSHIRLHVDHLDIRDIFHFLWYELVEPQFEVTCSCWQQYSPDFFLFAECFPCGRAGYQNHNVLVTRNFSVALTTNFGRRTLRNCGCTNKKHSRNLHIRLLSICLMFTIECSQKLHDMILRIWSVLSHVTWLSVLRSRPKQAGQDSVHN